VRTGAPGNDVGRPVGTGGGSIEVCGLGRTFKSPDGDVHALRDLSLRASPGEFVSIIGPSGCGKSTLFAILAGLDQPSAGQVLLGPAPVIDRLGACAYMPQHDALLEWRRVIDNVTLPLELAGAPPAAGRSPFSNASGSAGSPGRGPGSCPAACGSGSPSSAP
jgi:ABC-type nitrate/sulfonate/bicarbonate transport system ATPase subunit